MRIKAGSGVQTGVASGCPDASHVETKKKSTWTNQIAMRGPLLNRIGRLSRRGVIVIVGTGTQRSSNLWHRGEMKMVQIFSNRI
jgi:hypothetical protein